MGESRPQGKKVYKAVLKSLKTRFTSTPHKETSSNKYENLVYFSLDAMISMDRQGKVLLWNPAAEKLFGYFEKETIGQDLAQLIVPQEFRQQHYTGFFNLQDKKPFSQGKRMEAMGQNKNGQTFPIEIQLFQLGTEPQQEYLAAIRDIHEQKQAEEERRHYTKVLENAVEGISLINTDSRYLSVNKAYTQIHHYEADELIGKLWYITVAPESQKTLEDAYQTMLKTGRAEAEAKGVRKDGSEFFKQIVMVKNETPDGKFLGHYCFMKDITPRKILEEEIQHKNQELETTVEERTQQLQRSLTREQLIREITQSVLEETDLHTLFEFTVSKIGQLTQADRCVLWEYDNNVQQFKLLNYEYLGSETIPSMLKMNEPILFNMPLPKNPQFDAIILPEILKFEDLPPSDKQNNEKNEIKSILQIPIHYHRNFLGLLRIHALYKPKFWDKETLLMVKDVAAQLAIAIHKAQLLHELKQSEAKFRRIVDSNMIGILFFGANGQLVDANDAFLSMIGYTKTELLSGQVNWKDLIAPESSDSSNTMMKELSQEGVTQTYEQKLQSKIGKRIDALMGCALWEEDSQSAVCFIFDISLRKQIEEALKESEERFRTMADNAPVLIGMGNEDGQLIYFNKRWLDFTGQTLVHELTNQGWLESIHPDDREKLHTDYLEALKNRQDYITEFRLKNKDQTYHDMLGTGAPRFIKSGQLAGWMGSCIDITPIKQAQKAAEVANRKKNEFLSIISHELRTPLNSVIGFNEMLESGYGGPLSIKQKKYVHNVSVSAKHLLDMVEDILDITKMEEADIQLAPEWVDIDSLIENLKNVFSEQATRKNVQIIFDVSPLIDGIKGDPTRLKQIFYNLINNAIKFNRSGGTVTVKLSKTPDQQWLQCDVIDTGIGIGPDKIADLFHPFSQIDTSYTRQTEGTGLGLALTKYLVQLHGGSISVTSQLGVGSKFSFKLPTHQ